MAWIGTPSSAFAWSTDPARGLFEREAKQARGIESVHGLPAVFTVADITGHPLRTCDADEERHEPVISLTVQATAQFTVSLASRAVRSSVVRLPPTAPMVAPAVTASIEATLEHLARELERVDREIEQLFDDYPPLRRQRELLISIPGIAESTAARILGEMPNIAEFRDVKAIAAYAGLSPRFTISPARSNVAAGSRRSGNAHLRRALYFLAISAMRFNPPIRALATRLSARGKTKMTIVAAAMRKLLTLAYGVLKSGRVFDPLYANV